jgi:hypothetical protein
MLLLDRSGYSLAGVGKEDLNETAPDMLVSVAEGQMSFDQIEAWLTPRIVRKTRL